MNEVGPTFVVNSSPSVLSTKDRDLKVRIYPEKNQILQLFPLTRVQMDSYGEFMVLENFSHYDIYYKFN